MIYANYILGVQSSHSTCYCMFSRKSILVQSISTLKRVETSENCDCTTTGSVLRVFHTHTETFNIFLSETSYYKTSLVVSKYQYVGTFKDPINCSSHALWSAFSKQGTRYEINAPKSRLQVVSTVTFMFQTNALILN